MLIKFNIGDNVEVSPNKVKGTVIGIYITANQVKYQIRYFQSGESKSDYFYEFEVNDPTEKLLGFRVTRENR